MLCAQYNIISQSNWIGQRLFIIIRMVKFILFVLTFLVGVYSTDVCQPLLWDSDPTFEFKNNEVEMVAKKGILPDPIFKSEGMSNKVNYLISNITGVIIYDGSNRNVSKVGDNFIVKNQILNFNFTFKAESNKTKYSGEGTAYMKGAVVDYVKAPTKSNGSSGFVITKATITFPNSVVSNNDYKPTPSASDRDQFNSLLSVNLTQWVKDYYNKHLLILLNDAVIDNGIPTPFPGRVYKYTYGSKNDSMTVSVDTTIQFQLIQGDKGYIIGYNGSINNKAPRCSRYIPNNITNPASFITLQFVQNMYDEFVTEFSLWKSMTVDEKVAPNSYFGFKAIDLESVMPEVTATYPNYLNKVYANCQIDPSKEPEFLLDTSVNRIQLSAAWNCKLYLQNSSVLLISFRVENRYKLIVAQDKDKLRVNIVEARMKGVTWVPEQQFPVENANLAGIYLTAVVSAFSGKDTVGTGFNQIERKNPKVIMTDGAIQIYESADQVTQ